MTNGDWIRSLCDVELANLLADYDKYSPCQYCDYGCLKDGVYICESPGNFICVKRYASALICNWLKAEHDID